MKAQNYNKAIKNYSKALILTYEPNLKSSIFCNRSLAYLKLDLFEEARNDA